MLPSPPSGGPNTPVIWSPPVAQCGTAHFDHLLEGTDARKATQRPMLTRKHSESFNLENGVAPGWISLLQVLL